MNGSRSWRTGPLPRLTGAVLLAVLALAVAVLSLISGSSHLSASAALHALAGQGDAVTRGIVLQLRLPRLLAAFGIGSLLALAGVLLQALFRNPLADPFILGVSGGAAVGAVLALGLGAALAGVQGAAAAGALAAVLAVYALGGGGGATRLLLAGVALASLCGAVVTVVISAADADRIRGMVFWLGGDLGAVQRPLACLGAGCAAVAAAVVLARPLNVLAAGELRARSVGLDPGPWRALLYGLAAVLTGLAVVNAGTIGFVGLITPHSARLLFRTANHRIVAPAAALLGGTVLAAADLLARTLAGPRQLPVGAILAIAGTPLFLLLLRTRAGSR
ncbi:MAG TPA: iron ABC transporter permease [Steroidobacteraceae bacterium]|nr:iron ABC transporter permease [Steroidobacteraceae bacterium]